MSKNLSHKLDPEIRIFLFQEKIISCQTKRILFLRKSTHMQDNEEIYLKQN